MGNTMSSPFRSPSDLTVNRDIFTNVLLVGSCTVSFSEGAFMRDFGIKTKFVHVGLMDSISPEILNDNFDFQLSSIPLDHIMHLNTYLSRKSFDLNEAKSRFLDSLDEMHRLLSSLLRLNRETGLLTFVSNFLVPQQNPVGRLMPRNDFRNPVYYIEKLNEELANSVDQIKNAYIVDANAIASTVGKKVLQDDSIWKLSHGGIIVDQDYNDFESRRTDANRRIEPLSSLHGSHGIRPDEFYNALTAETVAMARTTRQIDSVKIVIVDLDDTMWRGVLAEGNHIDHEFLFEGLHYGFVEMLSFLYERGTLLAIASKNDHSKIESMWTDIFQGVFPFENFASVRINWDSKADNISSILSDVNLLSRNAVFIDDNPRERAEVKAAFPDIRVLGDNPYDIRRILLWSSESQVSHLTSEALNRTEMVKKQIDREVERKSLSKEEFLVSLSVNIIQHRIRSRDHGLFDRALELLNKTNQFNSTGRRWNEKELVEAMQNGGTIYAFEVSDKFTKYGAVIVAVRVGQTLSSFVMSCRVIGLEVELAALSLILCDKNYNDVGFLVGEITDTDANFLSRDLYARGGYDLIDGKWVIERSDSPSVPKHINATIKSN